MQDIIVDIKTQYNITHSDVKRFIKEFTEKLFLTNDDFEQKGDRYYLITDKGFIVIYIKDKTFYFNINYSEKLNSFYIEEFIESFFKGNIQTSYVTERGEEVQKGRIYQFIKDINKVCNKHHLMLQAPCNLYIVEQKETYLYDPLTLSIYNKDN